MKTFMGIDPGLNGALFVINEKGEEVSRCITPTQGNEIDLVMLNKFIRDHSGVTHCFLEKVHAMPGQGVSSMFKFGRVYGQVEALLSANLIPYTLITPGRWQAEVHQGITGKDAKVKSRQAYNQLFPNIELRELMANRKTPTYKKNAHDGLVDALLIAEVCRRKNG